MTLPPLPLPPHHPRPQAKRNQNLLPTRRLQDRRVITGPCIRFLRSKKPKTRPIARIASFILVWLPLAVLLVLGDRKVSLFNRD